MSGHTSSTNDRLQRSVTLSTDLPITSDAYKKRPKEPEMSVSKSQADRTRAQNASAHLVKHYRAIGPAAVLAAVLATKKRKPVVAAGKVA